jgi:hypothetical protein
MLTTEASTVDPTPTVGVLSIAPGPNRTEGNVGMGIVDR